MRLTRALVLTASAAVFASGAQGGVGVSEGPAFAAHQEAKRLLEASPALKFSPTTVLVRFNEGATPAQRAALRGLVEGQVVRTFDIVPGLEQIAVGMSVSRAIAVLNAAAPLVDYAEPDYVVHACALPNDPSFSKLWGLNQAADHDIDAPEAWNLTTGDPNFTVAVIDTGTQWNHPDLAANIWTNPGDSTADGVDNDADGYKDDIRGWDFYSNDNNPTDTDGHGTHTSGTVGAVGNNGVGVTGVNWRCKIVPLRFLGPSGGYTSDAVAAVNYCRTKKIKVSNNSWGGGGYSSSLFNAVNNAKSIGHIFVCAAGNDGRDIDTGAKSYPASMTNDNLIAVAATGTTDVLATWSNRGAVSVDLGAPGVNIYSTYKGSAYATMSGTSMASPHVAGVAALVYARNPTWTYSQVRSKILSTARPVGSLSGRTVTGGVVNAYDAVR